MSDPIDWPPEADVLEMAINSTISNDFQHRAELGESDEEIAAALEYWLRDLKETDVAIQVAYKVESDVFEMRHPRLAAFCITGQGLARIGDFYGGRVPKNTSEIERFAKQVAKQAWNRVQQGRSTVTPRDQRRSALAAACGDW